MLIYILACLLISSMPAFSMHTVRLEAGLEHKIAHAATDPNSNKLLLEALKKKQVDSAEVIKLIKNGANVNAQDAENYTPLILAAGQAGLEAIIKQLLTHQAQPNMQTRDGRTALMHASIADNIPGAILLLEAHANPDISDAFGKTALMYATEHDHQKLFTELLKHKADINKADKQGLTALMLAADVNNAEMVSELIKLNVLANKQDKDGNTALMRAILKKNRAMARLLHHTTNPFIKNKTGETARDIARKNGFHKLANLLDLEEMRWKESGRYSEWQKTGSALLQAATKSDLSEIRKLLDEGAPINARNMQQQTPLMLAVTKGSAEMVKLLSDAADANCYDRDGNTALMHAICHDTHYKILPLLLTSPEKINTQNSDGKTALMTAVLESNEKAVTDLLKMGADATLKTKDNKSALTLAAYKGNKNIMAMILTALPTIPEADLAKAVEIAKYFKNTDITKQLEECYKAKKTGTACPVAQETAISKR